MNNELERLRAICLRDSKVLKEALKRKYNKSMIAVVADALETEGNTVTPPEPQHGREPKPLAQYLATVSDMERPKTQAFFEQALDAYQSTENVTIKIERKT